MTTQDLMSINEAREWLRKAVALRGADFVYRDLDVVEEGDVNENCFYLPQPQLPEDDPRHRTGCLIGTAMMLAGREITPEHEAHNPSSLLDAWSLTPEAGSLMGCVQAQQDGGMPWGSALSTGEEAYNRLYLTVQRSL